MIKEAWNTGAVTSFSATFIAHRFNQIFLDGIQSSVTKICMGCFAMHLNSCLKTLTVSKIIGIHQVFKHIGSMFDNARQFNQTYTQLEYFKCNKYEKCLRGNAKFNQNIRFLEYKSVTNMSSMFYEASLFNQNIGNWNTSNVTNMGAMFYNASDFNQNIGNWNVSAVTNMNVMFLSAT